MSGMTKKHYELVATILRDFPIPDHILKTRLAIAFAKKFVEDNHRFDEQKFFNFVHKLGAK